MKSIFDYISLLGGFSVRSDDKTGELKVRYDAMDNVEGWWMACSAIVFIGLISIPLSIFLGEFAVILSLHIAALLSPLIGYCSRYLLLPLRRREIEYYKNNSGLPQNEIENFFKWKCGDTINLLGFKKQQYYGVLENGDIVLNYNGSKSTYPPLFIKRKMIKNVDLENRLESKKDERLENKVKNSEFQKIFEETSKELEKLEKENTEINDDKI